MAKTYSMLETDAQATKTSSQPPTCEGVVLTYHSDFYRVRLEDGSLQECKRKALLKKQRISIAVGDRVSVEPASGNSELGWIHAVLPPKTRLEKPRIHNITRVLIVCPWQEPEFAPRQLDRLLVKASIAALPVVLVITKADIQPDATVLGHSLAEWTRYYCNYCKIQRPHDLQPVFVTALKNRETWLPLQQYIEQERHMWVLAGVSGAGKSSLLNALDASLQLRVGSISHKIGRGAHTTRHTELHEALNGNLIADAPGFSQLNFSEEDPYTLATHFPEFQSVFQEIHPCEFQDCLHEQEPGCTIREHWLTYQGFPAQGMHGAFLAIRKSRYESYLEMLEEAKKGYELRLMQQQKQETILKTSKQGKGGKAVSIVKLAPDLRDANRRSKRQELKRLQEHVHQQQRLNQNSAYDDAFLDDAE
jgi:ribosome biogenesis GTPase / thiamine phosphate phosphatase